MHLKVKVSKLSPEEFKKFYEGGFEETERKEKNIKEVEQVMPNRSQSSWYQKLRDQIEEESPFAGIALKSAKAEETVRVNLNSKQTKEKKMDVINEEIIVKEFETRLIRKACLEWVCPFCSTADPLEQESTKRVRRTLEFTEGNPIRVITGTCNRCNKTSTILFGKTEFPNFAETNEEIS